ncbi:MAG: selenocysteine-specific translation elongation factor [Polyangia bacterium]|nr:selenocysteine-specific translation elongation factor [Polyangia bacterium]
MSTDRFVLGTAGHIDHGKTALVKALTGVDTDRLKEEKARGITIELGFASLVREGTIVGLVDVPGHERFIRAMAAGASGVDAVMLVVAADEGVMPQTREHLAVSSLLGVGAGFIALNKVDLVTDPEWLDLVESDLHDAVEGTFLESPRVIRCSAQTGEGLDEVRQAIFELAARVPARQSDGLLRLPMDRVFTMTGHGTVVTGTLLAGTVRLGDELVALPTELGGKVRGLQVHGQEVPEAKAGQRTAVNLKGVEHREISRGLVLAKQGELTPTHIFEAELRLLGWVERPVKRGQRFIVLAGTAQAQGAVVPLEGAEVEPGQTAWVQIQLDRPLVVLPGDRFVLQGFSLSRDHGSTIGGGVVVRSHPRRRRRRDPDYASLLGRLALATPPERVAEEVLFAGMAGLPLGRLSERLPFPPPHTAKVVAELLEKGQLVGDPGDALVHASPFAHLKERITAVVTQLAEASPMAESFGRQEILSRLGFELSPRIFALAVDGLISSGSLEGDAVAVAPAGSAGRKALRALAERVRMAIEDAGLEPPKAPELAASMGVKEQDVRDLLAAHLKAGRLVRAKDDFVFGSKAIEALQARLVAYLEDKKEISPTEFKELCGVTRKYLIPLSELFDERKVTLRVGNVRKLRQAPKPRP